MKNLIKSASRQYWVWVARPECYLDPDETDAEDLDPEADYDRSDMWWTCDRRTKLGDIALLYRTSPKSDIAYVIQAASNAFEISEDPGVRAGTWTHGCEYAPILKLSTPIPITDMREDSVLRNWCAVRMRFQRQVFPIQPHEWRSLMSLAADLNQKHQRWLKAL